LKCPKETALFSVKYNLRQLAFQLVIVFVVDSLLKRRFMSMIDA
jgi:hypothetical protein